MHKKFRVMQILKIYTFELQKVMNLYENSSKLV